MELKCLKLELLDASSIIIVNFSTYISATDPDLIAKDDDPSAKPTSIILINSCF